MSEQNSSTPPRLTVSNLWAGVGLLHVPGFWVILALFLWVLIDRVSPPTVDPNPTCHIVPAPKDVTK